MGDRQISISGEVAEVGLFGANAGASAVQKDIGHPKEIAILGNDHLFQGIHNRLNLWVDQTSGIQVSHPLGIGGVGPANGRVIALRQEYAVIVKVDHQTTDILVIAVGVDDRNGVPVCPGLDDGINPLGGIAIPQSIGLINEAGVRATGHDDVYMAEATGQFLLDRNLLHVGQQHHLVDLWIAGQQGIHIRLNLSG